MKLIPEVREKKSIHADSAELVLPDNAYNLSGSAQAIDIERNAEENGNYAGRPENRENSQLIWGQRGTAQRRIERRK